MMLKVLWFKRCGVESRYPPEIAVYPITECKEAIEYTEKITQFVINKIM